MDALEQAQFDASLRGQTPFASYQILDVTFSTNAGVDTEILHTLAPPTPDHIGWLVLRRSQPGNVYRAPGVLWDTGYVKLRSSVPGLVTTLLLFVTKTSSTYEGSPLDTAAGDPWLAAGATSLTAGVGFWLANNNGTPQMRIGDPSGGHMKWDGSTLSIAGTVSIEGYLADGEAAADVNANATTINGGKITTNTITAAQILTGTLTANKLAISYGSNQITNSEFQRGVSEALGDGSGWVTGDDTTGLTWTISYGLASWTLANSGTAYHTTTGTPAAATAHVTHLSGIPVTAGTTYQFSGYMGSHRCVSYVGIKFYASGAWGSYTWGNAMSSKSGGTTLADYGRCVVTATAPTGATLAQIAIRSVCTGAAAPYTFWTHLLFAEVPSGTTATVPWTAGGVTLITGNSLTTDVVVTSKLRSTNATALATGAGFWLDATGTPTFRVGDPSSEYLKWDGTNLTTSGSLAFGTAASVHSGTTTYASGTGIWMGYDSSAYKFRVGTTSGKRMVWDGTDLAIYGSGYSLTDDGGLNFGVADGETDFEHMVRWESYGQIGCTTTRLWFWGPGHMHENIYSTYIAFFHESTELARFNDSGVFQLKNADLAIDSGNDFYFAPSATTNNWAPLVWDSSSKIVSYKSDGYSGTFAVLASDGVSTVTLTFESGILVSVA